MIIWRGVIGKGHKWRLVPGRGSVLMIIVEDETPLAMLHPVC